MIRLVYLPALIALATLTSGCGLLPDAPENEYEGKNAAQLYSMGVAYRRNGNFVKAIETFDYLESSYPFDAYAQQGMLEMAYAHYRQEEYAMTIAVTKRFIEQNPVHDHIAYAYYLRGIAYFDFGRTLLHYVLPYIRHNKDPTPWETAFETFSLIVTNYPDSRYAVDARQRTIFLRNLLARYELHVADFYLRRKAYVAVINRSKYALERYHGTPYMGDLLWYLEQGYRNLEMTKLADDAKRVRDLNFPNYEAEKTAEEEEPSFWSETGDWISEAVDEGATWVGFDIEDLPPDNFSGKYQLVRLDLETESGYAATRTPDKVVVSQVPSGYRPDPSFDADNPWHQFLKLFGWVEEDPVMASETSPIPETTSTDDAQPAAEESDPPAETN